MHNTALVSTLNTVGISLKKVDTNRNTKEVELLTNPARRGRLRARAAATRTDNMLVSCRVYPAPERGEKDGGHGNQFVERSQ